MLSRLEIVIANLRRAHHIRSAKELALTSHRSPLQILKFLYWLTNGSAIRAIVSLNSEC
jgi:hypothetical protein